MKTGIIILNYNSSSDSQKCIHFLNKQERVDIDIIVVDNNSSKEDKSKLHNFCQYNNITFLANDENIGYNAGNNVGLRHIAEKGYKYALIANPDMEFPQRDYLLRMIEAMEIDHNIAVCGSDIITPEGIHQNPMKRDGNWKNSFGWITQMFKKESSNSYLVFDDYEHSHYCSKVSGCCLMVRMSFIEEIGYFDEYPFLYCEEAILSRQVELSNNWKVYYLSNAYAVHRQKKGYHKNIGNKLRHWKVSRMYFIEQYSGNNWLGKLIEKISFNLNILFIIIALKARKILFH